MSADSAAAEPAEPSRKQAGEDGRLWGRRHGPMTYAISAGPSRGFSDQLAAPAGFRGRRAVTLAAA